MKRKDYGNICDGISLHNGINLEFLQMVLVRVGLDLHQQEEVEKKLILGALNASEGDHEKAAEKLGIVEITKRKPFIDYYIGKYNLKKRTGMYFSEK